ncbi:hypothetical protein D3C76_1536660 [compost metagenome]
MHRVIALQAFAAQPGGERRVHPDHHAGLLAEGAQDAVQAAGGDVVGAGLLFSAGGAVGGEQGLAGGGQGQAEQRQAQGAGQWGRALVHEDDPCVGRV